MRSSTAAVLSIIVVVMILAGCVIVPIPGPDTAGISDPIPFSSSAAPRSTAQPVTKQLNNFAIIGVTSALSPFSLDEQQHYGSDLTQALRTAHPGYQLLSYDTVTSRLGSGQQQRVLDALRFSGNLNPEHLATLKPLGMNYVVLARLERDTLRYDTNEPQIANSLTPEQRRNLTGNIGRDTERTIVVTFFIYDLDEQKLIWQGNGEAKRTYSNSYRYSDTGDDADKANLRGRLQTNLNNQNQAVYPEPEALDALMKLAFANFAKQIPQTI
jgi:hypothetical protein